MSAIGLAIPAMGSVGDLSEPLQETRPQPPGLRIKAAAADHLGGGLRFIYEHVTSRLEAELAV